MKKLILLFASLFFATFIFAQAQNFKEIPATNLPKKCTEWITKNMPKATIEKAGTANSKGVLNYLVQVKVNKDKRLLHFDKDGNFIEKADKGARGTREQKPAAQPVKKTDQPKTQTATPEKK